MNVYAMVMNPTKAACENLYIAEQKFKGYIDPEIPNENVRKSLNQTYGGFTNDGRYYHNKSFFT